MQRGETWRGSHAGGGRVTRSRTSGGQSGAAQVSSINRSIEKAGSRGGAREGVQAGQRKRRGQGQQEEGAGKGQPAASAEKWAGSSSIQARKSTESAGGAAQGTGSGMDRGAGGTAAGLTGLRPPAAPPAQRISRDVRDSRKNNLRRSEQKTRGPLISASSPAGRSPCSRCGWPCSGATPPW